MSTILQGSEIIVQNIIQSKSQQMSTNNINSNIISIL